MTHAEGAVVPPQCPKCRGPLVCIGSSDAGAIGPDIRAMHAYWCPAGCHGAEADGTFLFVECPACGSHDTASGPQGDGVEEITCNACGAITSVQLVAAAL